MTELQTKNLRPREIVEELDKHIIGQSDAKRAVAIALRNRYRRKQVANDLVDEIMPKNILMIGPTGVGKTEISRRLAKLANAPFMKVEATKFTEVGYVGKDVESIIRDLVEQAVKMVREDERTRVKEKAEVLAEDRILDALVGEDASLETREKFRSMLRMGELADKEVELDLKDNASPFQSMDIPGMPGASMGMMNVGDMISKAVGGNTKRKKINVADAYERLMNEESDKLLDEEKLVEMALKIVENDGIVFLDEIDKITVRSDSRGGEVSREGVQRDLLPLLEGTVVSTKYGAVKTDHILFIASGAFHVAKPADLLPELQGRLPIRVELAALTEEDLIRILTEPRASLVNQYVALMGVDGVEVEFDSDAITRIAQISGEVNKNVENIGARRLHTIMEKLLEEVSYEAGDTADATLKVDVDYVNKHLGDLTQDMDLSKFIL